MTNFGQGTPLLEITPGRNCRLWPYLKGAGCTKAINQCKSQVVYGLPPAALQGMPVNYKYNLAGQKCGDTVENYASYASMDGPAPSDYATLFPKCRRCTDSSRVNGSGCRCGLPKNV
jgi:hypothetical protein